MIWEDPIGRSTPPNAGRVQHKRDEGWSFGVAGTATSLWSAADASALVRCDPANKNCSYVCLERGPTNHN
jgi:hypothetical protein